MKVLLIRFSSIGDIVLTSPVIRCLKQQLKDVELHVLTKEAFGPMYSLNPHVDRVFTIRKGIGEVLPSLRRERYDRIIDLHRNFRSLGVRLRLGRPASTFPKLNLRKWLLVRFKINLLPDIHVVDRYFKAVKSLSVNNDGKGLDFFMDPADEVDIQNLPAPFSDAYIAIVIGGKHDTKILPPEKVIELIPKLQFPVILLGGPEDAQRSENIVGQCKRDVLNACGQYSLGQSASLIKQARAVITNDTGLMHIAAAFRKRIISVWGNTVPSFGMYPYLPADAEPPVIAEVKGLRCRPCSKIGFDDCPKGHFRCMLEQDSDAIAMAAQK